MALCMGVCCVYYERRVQRLLQEPLEAKKVFYINMYKFNYFNIHATINNYFINKSVTLPIKDPTSLVTAQIGILHNTEKADTLVF